MSNVISVFRGDDHTLDVTVKQRSSTGVLTVVDVTGSSSVLTVKKAATDTVALISKAGTITDGPAGELQFVLVPSDTSSLTPGFLVYDVQVTLASGKIYTVLKDIFSLKQDVTP